MQIDRYSLLFSLVLVVILAQYVLVGRRRDARLNRRLQPYLGAFNIAFIVAVWLAAGAPVVHVLVIAPLLVLLTVASRKRIRYCDGCGATVKGRHLFETPVCCHECGASLQD